MKMVSVHVFRGILWFLSLFGIRKNLLSVDIAGSCKDCRELLRFMVYVKNVSTRIHFQA